MATFTEDNPKYRCCCQCMHVRTGALIIGIIHNVNILMSFMRFTRVTANLFDYTTANLVTIEDSNGNMTEVQYVPGFKDVVPSLLSAIMFVFSLICVVCLFWGICKSRAKFLIPEIVLLCASMFFCVSIVLFFILVLAVDAGDLNIYVKEQLQAVGQNDLPSTTRFLAKIVAGIGIVVFLAALGMTYWFYRVIRNCYDYLKEKEQYLRDGPAGARYAAGRSEAGASHERQPIVIIQPPSSAGADDYTPPPAYSEKY